MCCAADNHNYMCHIDCTFTVLYTCCVPFWNIIPCWNMFQIGMVCHSDKMCISETCFRLALCKFVILKPHVKYKVLKHNNLCIDKKVRSSYCICLFVFSSEYVLGCFKCNEFKRHRNMFQKYLFFFFSEWQTMPIWNKFQDSTCFRTARNTRANRGHIMVCTWNV